MGVPGTTGNSEVPAARCIILTNGPMSDVRTYGWTPEVGQLPGVPFVATLRTRVWTTEFVVDQDFKAHRVKVHDTLGGGNRVGGVHFLHQKKEGYY